MEIVHVDYFQLDVTDPTVCCEVTYVDGSVERFCDVEDILKIQKQLARQQSDL